MYRGMNFIPVKFYITFTLHFHSILNNQLNANSLETIHSPLDNLTVRTANNDSTRNKTTQYKHDIQNTQNHNFMHLLANHERKQENCAAILTLYIKLRQDFKLLYSVLHIFYNFKRVSVLKCYYKLHIRQK
jgi:hypothetical protein